MSQASQPKGFRQFLPGTPWGQEVNSEQGAALDLEESMIRWEEWASEQMLQSGSQCYRAGCYESGRNSLLSPGDGGGLASEETRIKSRALTHSSYGKTVRPQASLLTSLEPWFFHPKKWEGHRNL